MVNLLPAQNVNKVILMYHVSHIFPRWKDRGQRSPIITPNRMAK